MKGFNILIYEEKLIDLENSHLNESNQIIGYSDFHLIINKETTNNHHKHKCHSEEYTLGNLSTDSIMSIGEFGIVLKNSWSIRGDLVKGNITVKEIINALPYYSEIIIKEVLGKEFFRCIRTINENVTWKISKIPQVSGIKLDINTDIKSSIELDENERSVNITGKSRVSNVIVGKKELDLNKSYKIALDKFISEGGDGFSMFSKYKDYLTTSGVDNESVMKYIQNDLKGIIPKKYNKIEGRINIYPKSGNENSEKNEGEKKTTKILLGIFIALGIICIIIIIYVIYLKKKKIQFSSEKIANLNEEKLLM